jgi:hypothetical protein
MAAIWLPCESPGGAHIKSVGRLYSLEMSLVVGAEIANIQANLGSAPRTEICALSKWKRDTCRKPCSARMLNLVPLYAKNRVWRLYSEQLRNLVPEPSPIDHRHHFTSASCRHRSMMSMRAGRCRSGISRPTLIESTSRFTRWSMAARPIPESARGRSARSTSRGTRCSPISGANRLPIRTVSVKSRFFRYASNTARSLNVFATSVATVLNSSTSSCTNEVMLHIPCAMATCRSRSSGPS